MKVPRSRRAYEGARPPWRPRLAWLWVLAFPRQRHQQSATILSDLDATERRVTELYAKAVEKLGSDKAPVRFGGLHALERLAQDNPAHRQTIVDVICAYLRMPFSPTTLVSKREPEVTDRQKGPGVESGMGTDGIGSTWQQERELHLTAQRILTEHLHDDRSKDKKSMPPGSRFWNNICLDLAGATLIDFSLANGVMADANFHRAIFTGDASFTRAAFTGAARFSGATFRGDALFGGAVFGGAANFPEADFRGDALFGEAAFTRGAGFRRAAFGASVGFGKATFGGDARFGKAAFTGSARFGEADFRDDALFGGAVFGEAASFDEATFTGDARFGKATFSGDAWFDEATFSRGAEFGKADFRGDAWFGKARSEEHTSDSSHKTVSRMPSSA